MEKNKFTKGIDLNNRKKTQKEMSLSLNQFEHELKTQTIISYTLPGIFFSIIVKLAVLGLWVSISYGMPSLRVVKNYGRPVILKLRKIFKR